ncbi:STAS domain-containing protein [Magnetospirillum molischianum]|uniref:Anti-anti-sigma regulatory factor n=1 Tax=Magnetospirillum molischianum DSM 120 TaxID=1150626 RepID=H8FNG6_MAGML|nr:STAS domain-containing protein [Magnetospirillum molischianum]CCG39904.1 Anti-anti-sigma regulatory factor [Magnetospirillum molischianum DSM 120]
MEKRGIRYRLVDDDDGLTVALEGRLDFAAERQFQELLADLVVSHRRQVRFDLSGLSHVDSVGLGLLYIAHEDLGKANIALALLRPRDTVLRMLELTETTKVFAITR